jgi:hypothetical protein
MAKNNVGTLAGIAALGTLAYMNRDKLGMGDKSGNTTVDSKPTRNAGYNSTETRPDVRTDFGGAGDEMSNVRRDISSGDEMSKYAANYKPPTPAPVKPSNVVTGNDLPPADENSTPLETITRNYKDPEKQKVYDTLNEKSGANTSSALRSDQLAGVSRAVNREAKTSKAAQGEFSDYTRTFKNPETQKWTTKTEPQILG